METAEEVTVCDEEAEEEAAAEEAAARWAPWAPELRLVALSRFSTARGKRAP